MSTMSTSALAIRKQAPRVWLPKRPAPAPRTPSIATIPNNTSVGSHHTRGKGGAVVKRPQRNRLGVRYDSLGPTFAPWRNPYTRHDPDDPDEATSDDAPVTNSKVAPAANSKAAPKAASKDHFGVGCGQAKDKVAPWRKPCNRLENPDEAANDPDEAASDDAPVTNSKVAPAANSKAAPKAASKDHFGVGCGQAKDKVAPWRKPCNRLENPDEAANDPDEAASDDAPVTNSKAAPAANSKAAPKEASKASAETAPAAKLQSQSGRRGPPPPKVPDWHHSKRQRKQMITSTQERQKSKSSCGLRSQPQSGTSPTATPAKHSYRHAGRCRLRSRERSRTGSRDLPHARKAADATGMDPSKDPNTRWCPRCLSYVYGTDVCPLCSYEFEEPGEMD